MAENPQSRYEKSLGLLTTKFVNLLQKASGGVLDLKIVSKQCCAMNNAESNFNSTGSRFARCQAKAEDIRHHERARRHRSHREKEQKQHTMEVRTILTTITCKYNRVSFVVDRLLTRNLCLVAIHKSLQIECHI